MTKRSYPSSRKCYKCKNNMILDLKRKIFRCQKKGHEVNTSIFKNTFFPNSNVPINKILQICYLYLHKSATSEIVKLVGVYKEVVIDWCTYTRELLADCLDFDEIKSGS
ncbi:hypothetical protein H311_01565 [Anncaliia algerae PRA109]|nr:hypothetical protein H311_01565 [Anncaliia algerae PRA109]